jgi:hypothetical protein
MKPCLLAATFVAVVFIASPSLAGGGYPAQVMPSYPHPSYCEPCFPQWEPDPRQYAVKRYWARRPVRAQATSQTLKSPPK